MGIKEGVERATKSMGVCFYLRLFCDAERDEENNTVFASRHITDLHFLESGDDGR